MDNSKVELIPLCNTYNPNEFVIFTNSYVLITAFDFYEKKEIKIDEFKIKDTNDLMKMYEFIIILIKYKKKRFNIYFNSKIESFMFDKINLLNKNGIKFIFVLNKIITDDKLYKHAYYYKYFNEKYIDCLSIADYDKQFIGHDMSKYHKYDSLLINKINASLNEVSYFKVESKSDIIKRECELYKFEKLRQIKRRKAEEEIEAAIELKKKQAEVEMKKKQAEIEEAEMKKKQAEFAMKIEEHVKIEKQRYMEYLKLSKTIAGPHFTMPPYLEKPPMPQFLFKKENTHSIFDFTYPKSNILDKTDFIKILTELKKEYLDILLNKSKKEIEDFLYYYKSVKLTDYDLSLLFTIGLDKFKQMREIMNKLV